MSNHQGEFRATATVDECFATEVPGKKPTVQEPRFELTDILSTVRAVQASLGMEYLRL